MRPPRSTTTTTVSSCDWFQSIIQHGTSNRYICVRWNFKSKNITVHGNTTIIKQTCPKLVHSVAQRNALELKTIVEEKCLI